mmetsp:Transcript_123525/g.384527  ORF Transcript_123525/g.384527 Transcript_123525/m.384527 type:complete len:269 (+) Transcript_123525:355-1161(+)
MRCACRAWSRRCSSVRLACKPSCCKSACRLRSSKRCTRSWYSSLERSISPVVWATACSSSEASAREASSEACRPLRSSRAACVRSRAAPAVAAAWPALASSSLYLSRPAMSLPRTWSRCSRVLFSSLRSSSCVRWLRAPSCRSSISLSKPSGLSATWSWRPSIFSFDLTISSCTCTFRSSAAASFASVSSRTRSAVWRCRRSLSNAVLNSWTSFSAAHVACNSLLCCSWAAARSSSSWLDRSTSSRRTPSCACRFSFMPLVTTACTSL